MPHMQREGFQGIWKVAPIKTGSGLPDRAIPLVPQSHDLDKNRHLEYVWWLLCSNNRACNWDIFTLCKFSFYAEWEVQILTHQIFNIQILTHQRHQLYFDQQ